MKGITIKNNTKTFRLIMITIVSIGFCTFLTSLFMQHTEGHENIIAEQQDQINISGPAHDTDEFKVNRIKNQTEAISMIRLASLKIEKIKTAQKTQ